MGLKQKYIEDKHIKCKFDDSFIDELITLPYEAALGIMKQVKKNSPQLPEKDNWSQMVGGVIKTDPPFFFELEYVRYKGTHPVYIDVMEINLDDYLDYINLNKYLK